MIEARERDRASLPLDNDALARLTIPVLLVHGLADHEIPLARTSELVNVIPTADAVLYQGCWHWSQIERAEAFSQLVVDFAAGDWRDRP